MIDGLISLWLPILASAVAVWFWCFLSWAMLPLHKNDHLSVPNEDGFMNTLRGVGLAPGSYAFPHCKNAKNPKDPEFQAKWKAGPSGMLNVWSPNISMGKCMVLSFLVNVLAGVLIAYLMRAAGMQNGASFTKVLQVAGAAGILAHGIGWVPGAIWFQASANSKLSCTVDSVVNGLLTGVIFAALWPKMAVAGTTIPLPG